MDVQADLFVMQEQMQREDEADFYNFIEMMEHRSLIAKENACPNCGYKTLEPISISESKCETCEQTFKI